MRSRHPMPGNPWPHDMVLAIESEPHELLELLWIREVWQLQPEGDDLPPELVDAPARVSAAERATAPIAEWQDAWPELWRACLLHAGTPHDPTAFERVQASEPGSPERARLMHELIGPRWHDRFGDDALAPGNDEWRHQRFEQHAKPDPRPLDEQPERVALDALIPAWRAGLTKIVEIPCRGTFTRVVGAHALLLTAETRADPARFREALAVFG